MGYQLVFWQQRAGVRLVAESVYQSLMNDETVAGLNELAVGDFLEGLAAAFGAPAQHNAPDGTTFLELGESHGVMEISTSSQHVLVECRGVPDEDMNRVIDVASAHGCPLYDPQTNERFDAAT